MSAKKLRILVLEDNAADADLVVREVERGGIAADFKRVATRESFVEALGSFLPDMVFADYSLPQFTGMDALQILRGQLPDVPLIIVTGAISEEVAAECIVMGAADYVLKDHLARLLPAVQRALERRRMIDENRQTEEALRESEERYRLLLQNANDAVLVHETTEDHPGRFLQVNDQACRMLGYSSDEFLKMSVEDIDVPEQRERVPDIQRRLFDAGCAIFETEHLAKDGRRIPVEVSIRLFKIKDRPIVLSVVRDITERKSAEAALRESEAKYRALIRFAADAILIVDQNGKIIESNPRSETMLGYSAMDSVGVDFVSCHSESERARATGFVGLTNKLKKPAQYETTLYSKDGPVIPVEVLLSAVDYSDKHVMKATLRDMTERRKAEQLRNNMIRYLTHKLMTPIATAKMASDLIDGAREHRNDEQLDKALAMITRSMRKMGTDIDRIMKYQSLRSTEGRRELAAEKTSLVDVLDRVLKEEEPRATSAGVKLQISKESGANDVLVGDMDLYTIVGNVIDNAVKFTRQGSISVSIHSAGDRVRVTVVDTGIGIEPALIEHVFDGFFQASAATAGIGLGLAICKGMVERYGGSIKVSSDGAGKGTTVVVELPRV